MTLHIPLLRDGWLDESEKIMKRTLKTKILEIVPAKCDRWNIFDVGIFYCWISAILTYIIISILYYWHYYIKLNYRHDTLVHLAVLKILKNGCCACIWDQWINWIESVPLSWLMWSNLISWSYNIKRLQLLQFKVITNDKKKVHNVNEWYFSSKTYHDASNQGDIINIINIKIEI